MRFFLGRGLEVGFGRGKDWGRGGKEGLRFYYDRLFFFFGSIRVGRDFGVMGFIFLVIT